MKAAALRCGFSLALLSIATGFSPVCINRCRPAWSRHSTLSPDGDGAQSMEEDDSHPLSDHSYPSINNISRRQWLTSQVVASSSIVFGTIANANAEDEVGGTGASRIVPRNKSVLVLGANGGTGRECVSAVSFNQLTTLLI